MRDRLLYFISPIALLIIWELLVVTGLLDRRFFPAPSETIERLVTLLEDGTLVTATVITLRRLVVGFTLATVPAILVGLFMGISRTARLALSPLVTALYPVPKIALVPMVVTSSKIPVVDSGSREDENPESSKDVESGLK